MAFDEQWVLQVDFASWLLTQRVSQLVDLARLLPQAGESLRNVTGLDYKVLP